jgi:hypothetical protein
MTIYNADEAMHSLEMMREKLDDVIFMADELELDSLAQGLMVYKDDIEEYYSLVERFGDF